MSGPAFDDAFDFSAFDADDVPIPEAGVDVPDHATEAVNRLPSQFRKPKIEAMLRAFVGPAQSIESAAWQLLTQRVLPNAKGVQLDVLGDLVGERRDGLLDDDYRRFIAARIATNRSRGTTENLIRVTKLVLLDDATGLTIRVMTEGTAAVEVSITDGPIGDNVAGIVIQFLRQARSSAMKLVLVTQPDDDAHTFSCGNVVFLGGSHSIGATTVSASYRDGDGVDPRTLFPSTGSLILDEGTAAEETVSYTLVALDGIDPTLLHFTTSALTHNHAADTPCARGDAPGLGLGDGTESGQPTLMDYSNAGTTGGRLRDARA